VTTGAPDSDRWQGTDDFKAAVREWARTIGVSPRRIQVQRMNKKWASCSKAGTLTFSTELLDEPREFGEAVIVHELIHLIAPNHGRLFRGLYSSYMPNWPEIVGDRAICGALRS
jgi:predicted metal-dependent hydrolase